MQKALKLIYPDQCVGCGALVEGPQGLCGPCWSETPFIEGLVCDACGVPLLGEAAGEHPLCDRCLEAHPSWMAGRAALEYRDNARRLILSLKHGDRLDLARPMARWLAVRGHVLKKPGICLVPVPMHWTRLFTRRFNQAALLSAEVARLWGTDHVPDALIRVRRTPTQNQGSFEAREANLSGAISPNPRKGRCLDGRSVVLVDDVMTSGATLRASTEAARAAGAKEVSVLVLARVVKA